MPKPTVEGDGAFELASAIKLLVALAVVLGQPTMAEAQYVPPMGIPAPSFGINESHQRYAGQTYAAGGFAYRDAGNGPYSHYVDRSVACTDSGNLYGMASSPRCSIPSTLTAGSVVEVHGGPYSHTSINAAGTAALPVFVRGVSSTQRFTSSGVNLMLSGSFLIVEYLDHTGGFVALSGELGAADIALRHSYIHDHPTGTGSFVRLNGTRVVAYDNEVARNGGTDRHGFGVANGASNVWILNNHSHNHSGDSIQFCHQCVPGPSNVYIGGNEFHDDVENAVDLKATPGPVVISENHFYNYRSSPTSNGDVIRVNDEGAKGEVWILANRIHDAVLGINPDNARTQGVFVIGNVIWNISGSAIGRDSTIVLNNTLYNVGVGIADGDDVRNNIIMNASMTAIATAVGTCSHNLVFGGGDVASACTNGTTGNPLLVNASAGDFRLQAGSPARNAGTVASSYQTFLTKYGRSIAFDLDHRPRPQEDTWDLGAYEFGTGPTTPTPSAPPTPTGPRIIR